MDVSFGSFNPAPVAATAVPPAPRPTRVEGHEAKKTDAAATRDPILDSAIMILDDEPYNVMVVRKYLRDVGYSNLLECHRSVRGHEDHRPEEAELAALGRHDAQSERTGHPPRASLG